MNQARAFLVLLVSFGFLAAAIIIAVEDAPPPGSAECTIYLPALKDRIFSFTVNVGTRITVEEGDLAVVECEEVTGDGITWGQLEMRSTE